MALSRANTRTKTADPAKLLLLIKRLVKHNQYCGYRLTTNIHGVKCRHGDHNHNPNVT